MQQLGRFEQGYEEELSVGRDESGVADGRQGDPVADLAGLRIDYGNAREVLIGCRGCGRPVRWRCVGWICYADDGDEFTALEVEDVILPSQTFEV